MKKILFIISMVMCSLFVNAQGFNNNYKYSFWSNWSIGAGAVYSKPFDLTSWSFNDKANVGVDVRLQKQLSKFWTLRLDACIPTLVNVPACDCYGTAMVGMNFNIGDAFYIFADGGISAKRFNLTNDNKNVWLSCDAGIGAKTKFSYRSSMFIEIGADCGSYFSIDNLKAYGKLGYLFNFGVTQKDKDALAEMNEDKQENCVPISEYENLKQSNDSLQIALSNAISEINKIKTCCETNTSVANDKIAELSNALDNIKSNAITSYGVPFSVLFSKNSVELDVVAKEIIRNVAVEMNNDENATYTLYGFGDFTGSDDFNQVISEARCESVKKQLIKNGVDENRINVVGFGKTKYFGDSESYLNRRVTFVKNF